MLCETQIEFEESFNKNTLFRKVRFEYENEPEIINTLKTNDIDIQFGLNFLTHVALHDTVNVPTLVGLLKKDNTAQQCANNILKCIEADLADYCTNRKIVIATLLPDGDLMNELNQYIYPLPLITEPKKVTNNNQDAYITYNSHVILGGKYNHHDNDVCLDHINRLNQTKLCLNELVINKCINKWSTKKSDTKDTKQKKKKALEAFMNIAKDSYLAMLIQSNKFSMSHKYDKRGRTYTVGYHINYMGNQYQKACVELADKELIND